jgi:hypothetical protein
LRCEKQHRLFQCCGSALVWFQCGSGRAYYDSADPVLDPGSQTNADPDPSQTFYEKYTLIGHKTDLHRYNSPFERLEIRFICEFW